jgi:hypothetical protein
VEAGPLTNPPQRKRALVLNTLDGARAGYVVALQRVHPAIETQLSDVRHLLDALLGVDSPVDGGPLSTARTAYLVTLRRAHGGINEQLLDLAQVCADLFAPSLGLLAAVRPCSDDRAPRIRTSAEQGT